jgi:hypothetical protein
MFSPTAPVWPGYGYAKLSNLSCDDGVLVLHDDVINAVEAIAIHVANLDDRPSMHASLLTAYAFRP